MHYPAIIGFSGFNPLWPLLCQTASQILVNSLRPRQNGRHFEDDIFKCIFLNENVWFLNKISLKFVPKGPINNIPALVQIMAWRRPGDKPLSEPMMISLPTHKCVTRPQWVNTSSVNGSLPNGLLPSHYLQCWLTINSRVMLTWKLKLSIPKLCLKFIHLKS